MKKFAGLLFILGGICLSCTNTVKTEDGDTESAPIKIDISKEGKDAGFPLFEYDSTHVFPTTRDLDVPEDGAGLPDGRLVVADDTDGLHLIEKDGSHRIFGKMKEKGYKEGGARGVFLEDNNKFLLVSCVYSGKIFRINIETEDTEMIYQHSYGVNNVYRDKKGSIWFSQSSNNPNGTSEALDDAFATPIPTGAVYMLKEGRKDNEEMEAKLVADSLYFANGITMDKDEEHLFVAEFRIDRILRFKIDREKDTLSEKQHYAFVLSPDNLETDENGNLWLASLIQNKILAIDKDDQSIHNVFSAPSPDNSKKQLEWVLKTHLGESIIDIGEPEMWKPLNNPLTGVFWSHDRSTVYFTGLGNALLRYDYDSEIEILD
ncbi:SMP-30/gluconolactonase/LRE family protein [Christiangramia crocea]|uniref:SMP-30/gluconolactonase/LRE family protein n=1 Tax=Christiangramia crocea TaxID=2904124 RepID=A0A9X1UVN7_9FLAO|nr:SMP-30/gluconolactonase/LRE family protein [Gramella crocea]MCG9970930.1 SMP-30/gluconolactonase/LRE family protein [Gramella crocea]